MRQKITSTLRVLAILIPTSPAMAIEAAPLVTNVAASNLFSNGPIAVTPLILDGTNITQRFRFRNGPSGGSSFVIAISNGENGFNGIPGNLDNPNPTGVGAAIDIVNGGDGTMGNRLTNGNTFRFSVWVQQDPTNPVTTEPSVEPQLKFEIWKEAQSLNADNTSGRQPFQSFGDRLWDTAINAPDAFYDGFNQSKASNIDINNNGSILNGDEVTVSIGPATTFEEWVLVETYLVIDDDPDDSGFGWDIGAVGYDVSYIEEIRATFFVGDFTGTSPSWPANGGAFLVDNALLEIFPDEATMLATPNPNPNPAAPPTAPGDFDEDGDVDGRDFLIWQRGGTTPALGPGLLDDWQTHYGNGTMTATIMAYGQSVLATVPEPTSAVLVMMAGLALVGIRRPQKLV